MNTATKTISLGSQPPGKTTALPAGKPAPDFALHSTPDQTVRLSEFRGRPVVLAFYPADWSPVCGDQMGLYNELLSEETAVKLSTERYVAGKADYYEVLEAQQQLFPAQLNLARTQRDQLLAVVTLYKTLGGGWQDEMKSNQGH